MNKTPLKWSLARSQMQLDPSVTMLNTGSFGPLPHSVFNRVTELRRQLAAGPTDFFVRQAPPLLWHAREELARFLGADVHRLIFTVNVSAAINLVASGFPFQAPGEILITDHEYGAMVWCWERAAQRFGLELKTFPLPTMPKHPGEIVDAAVRAMTPRTRVFFLSHVLSPTGMVLPVRELCAEARKRGILTIVDGAHAPAMVPLNVRDIGADFYTGNCHKWLLAPTGTGFLIFGPGQEDRLQPLQVSWGYKPDSYPLGDNVVSPGPDTPDVYGSTPRIRNLEFEGTRDFCPWLTVPEAIRFQTDLGWDAVRNRMAELAHYSRWVIGEQIGLKLATPAVPELHGAMTAFELPPGFSAIEWRKKLWDARVEIPIIERPDRLLIRVSHHFYTTEAEIDHLAEVLKTITYK